MQTSTGTAAQTTTGGSTGSSSSSVTSGTSSGSTQSSSASSGATASGSTSGASSTTGHATSSSSSSGSTTGAPSCTDCRKAGCDCAGLAPYCNASTGLCLSCRSGADCPSAAEPRCDPAAGICVACLADSDCTTDPRTPHCSSIQTCVACTSDGECSPDGGQPHCGTDPTVPLFGQCWQCGSPNDCVVDQYCDPYLGLCTPGCPPNVPANRCSSGCATNSAGYCTRGSCQVDTDCGGATPICDPVYENCVACSDDSFCAAEGMHCQTNPLQPNYGTCQVCVGNGQGQCDTGHGWLCEINDDCELDCRLDAGYAVCGWGLEGEMLGFPVCNQATGLCGQCARAGDCQLLGEVLGTALPPICDTFSNACVYCTGYADCAFDRAGCIPKSGCDQCQNDADCPQGQICHDTPGAPAFQGGPQFCFCKDDSSCGGGSCVLPGGGQNGDDYNPYNLLTSSYSGYTGQCYCTSDANCKDGLACVAALGSGLVNDQNNPGHCCPPGSSWSQAAGVGGIGGACVLPDGGTF